MVLNDRIKYSEIKSSLIFFFLAEFFLAGLALLDPLFVYGIILLVVALPLFYYTMLKKCAKR